MSSENFIGLTLRVQLLDRRTVIGKVSGVNEFMNTIDLKNVSVFKDTQNLGTFSTFLLDGIMIEAIDVVEAKDSSELFTASDNANNTNLKSISAQNNKQPTPSMHKPGPTKSKASKAYSSADTATIPSKIKSKPETSKKAPVNLPPPNWQQSKFTQKNAKKNIAPSHNGRWSTSHSGEFDFQAALQQFDKEKEFREIREMQGGNGREDLLHTHNVNRRLGIDESVLDHHEQMQNLHFLTATKPTAEVRNAKIENFEEFLPKPFLKSKPVASRSRKTIIKNEKSSALSSGSALMPSEGKIRILKRETSKNSPVKRESSLLLSPSLIIEEEEDDDDDENLMTKASSQMKSLSIDNQTSLSSPIKFDSHYIADIDAKVHKKGLLTRQQSNEISAFSLFSFIQQHLKLDKNLSIIIIPNLYDRYGMVALTVARILIAYDYRNVAILLEEEEEEAPSEHRLLLDQYRVHGGIICRDLSQIPSTVSSSSKYQDALIIAAERVPTKLAGNQILSLSSPIEGEWKCSFGLECDGCNLLLNCGWSDALLSTIFHKKDVSSQKWTNCSEQWKIYKQK